MARSNSPLNSDDKISRRTLAKVLAAGSAASALPHWLKAEAFSTEAMDSQEVSLLQWQTVHPGIWRVTLGTPERFTPVSSRYIPPQTEILKKLPAAAKVPLGPISGKVTDRGCLLHLPLRADEQVYGLGLQMLSLAQRGKKKISRVNADPRFDTGDSHAPVPFYVTTEGIGIFVDTTRYATFYFGDAHPAPRAAITNQTAQGSLDPNYTHNLQEGDRGNITIEIPVASGVDVYLFAGPEMLDAVRRFNEFSGGGFVPPEWGLGFWYRCDAHATQDTALAIAHEFRERKIPCDVIGLEPGWQTHAYSCSFAWDQGRFPDPKQFLRDAGEMRYKVNLWEHAFTHPTSPVFASLEPFSGDMGVWGGLVPDFAAEPARSAFGEYHGKALIDLGVSGFKLDECDNSDFTGGWSFPECSRFPSGIDGEQMHSVFGLRYQQALWEQFRKRDLPTYGLVRSSGALAAPYPFVLYSDLYGHRDYIRALVNSGFSGLLWGPEVRDAQSEEDLIRRLQSVVFSPLASVNCWYMKSPPWKQLDRKKNNAGVLLENWERLEARCREIICWRMQLIPYLTAAFARYAEDGTPPFRALVLDAPKEPALQKVDDQYMVGDRMIVAPLFAGEQQRKVLLPSGQWHDFWTGELHSGNSEIIIPESYEAIPVYVKSGSIVPWADAGLYADSPESRRITARVYGDGSLPALLYDRANRQRLTWNGEQGRVEGSAGTYEVYAWKHMG
jgi:alpha-D-xyloside xylohydrolase